MFIHTSLSTDRLNALRLFSTVFTLPLTIRPPTSAPSHHPEQRFCRRAHTCTHAALERRGKVGGWEGEGVIGCRDMPKQSPGVLALSPNPPPCASSVGPASSSSLAGGSVCPCNVCVSPSAIVAALSGVFVCVRAAISGVCVCVCVCARARVCVCVCAWRERGSE